MAFSTISKPGLYFNTLLYTGNGASPRAMTGVGFQPDMLWIKSRDTTTYEWRQMDSVRGSNRVLHSSTNTVENTEEYYTVASFDTDGWTGRNGTGSNQSVTGGNDNGVGFGAWSWKAGTTGSGTSTGSGTGKAYSYSVNTTSGFSIIKYLGNGTANHTIPHHLGAEPHWIIIKQLTGTYDWRVYFKLEGNQKIVRLNTTGAASSSTDYWNNTTPTSTVFNLGTGGGVNANDVSYIAYCFAPKQGYSKMGKYDGTGNADGPFIYTGFKPALVIIKDTDNAENWFLFDSKRPGYNLNANHLNPNSNTTETASSANTIDLYSNGFKMKATNNGINRSGGQGFNYLAIAEEPLVANVSNSIPATAR